MKAHAIASANRMAMRMASSIRPQEGPSCTGRCSGLCESCIDSVYGLGDARRAVSPKSPIVKQMSQQHYFLQSVSNRM